MLTSVILIWGLSLSLCYIFFSYPEGISRTINQITNQQGLLIISDLEGHNYSQRMRTKTDVVSASESRITLFGKNWIGLKKLSVETIYINQL